MIDKDDVRKVARLARVKLDDDELAIITRDLTRVVGYVDALFAVDVGASEPMTHAVPLTAPQRADEPAAVLGAAALTGSAGLEENLVRVPRVV
jgi:aspartyl-tRNA(Asn)/glutamyl-tRNA(Gln) amidotransferase subunit C